MSLCIFVIFEESNHSSMLRKYTFKSFEKMSNEAFSKKYSGAACLPAKYIEEEFWREIACSERKTVKYAGDVEGSAFSSSSTDQLGNSKWNLKVFFSKKY